MDEDRMGDPTLTYTEASWNPVTMDDLNRSRPTVYRLSKKYAEKAAWEFVENEKPGFDLATVCPPLVLGPVVHHLATLDSINTSNERVVELLRGQWTSAIPGAGSVQFWVSVRDAARAHILAMERPEAGGKRLFTTAGYFSNRGIVDTVRANFPELEGKLPPKELKGGEGTPEDKSAKYDNSATVKALGIEWETFESSIIDLVKSIKDRI